MIMDDLWIMIMDDLWILINYDDGLDYDFTFWIGVQWSMIFTGLWPFRKFSQELISPPWTSVFFPTRTFFFLLSARLAQCMASGDWTVFHRNYINLSVYNCIYIIIYIYIIDIHLCCIWCHDAFVWFLWPLKLDAKVQTKLDEDDCGQKVMKLQKNFHKMVLTRSRRTLCSCYRKGEARYLKVFRKKSVSDQHKLSPKLGNFPIDPSWKAGTTVKFL